MNTWGFAVITFTLLIIIIIIEGLSLLQTWIIIVSLYLVKHLLSVTKYIRYSGTQQALM